MSDTAFTALPRHDVALLVAGQAYLGWTALTIELGIDRLIGSFSLELASRDRTAAQDWAVAAGDDCQIVLGGKALITGYVDSVSRGLEAEQHTLTVAGRDKACDLVDCAALNKPGSWRNVTLEKIAGELAAPFGVSIQFTSGSGKPLARFALQQGETAWAAIERAARYRGLIAFSDGQGGIKIGNPDSGIRSGRIAEGNNLLSITAEVDHSQRFSQYVVKGQSSGTDDRHGKVVAQIKGEANDAGVTRYRPMMVIGEEQSDAASLKKRANWEATVRAARAEKATVSVPGWFAGDGSANGPVWEPGARADCDAPSVKISGDRLIESLRLSRDDQGTRTELVLVAPAAWTQLAEPEPKPPAPKVAKKKKRRTT